MPTPAQPHFTGINTALALAHEILDAQHRDDVAAFGADADVRLAEQSVSWLKGIGQKTADELGSIHGIHTLLDLARYTGPLDPRVTDELSDEAKSFLATARQYLRPTRPSVVPLPELDGELALRTDVLDQSFENELRKSGISGALLNRRIAEAPLAALKGIGAATAAEITKYHGFTTLGGLAAWGSAFDQRVVDQLSPRERVQLYRAISYLRAPEKRGVSAALAIQAGLIDASQLELFEGPGADALLAGAELDVLKGIGEATEAYLRGFGVHRVEQLVNADLAAMFAVATPPGAEAQVERLRLIQIALQRS